MKTSKGVRIGILATIFLIALILNILAYTNSLTNQKYLIEPFESGNDILELKRIAIQLGLELRQTMAITLFLFFFYILVSSLIKSIDE